jgi:hypothetical protein
MISSGFTNAPVSQFLVFGTVIAALLATITDTRYYLHVLVVPHIWGYGQFWRFATWQVCHLLMCIFFLGHLGKRWIRERRMARGRGITTIIITKRKEADMRVQQQKASYTNSTEVLFAVVSFYQLRVIERLWGSRKFAVSFAYTDICSSLCLDSPTLCISSKKSQ